MFERFTEEARSACILAVLEAGNRGCKTAKPEHFLLGLLREDVGLAEQFLDVNATKAYIQEMAQACEHDRIDTNLVSLDPGSERALSFAAEEAKLAGFEEAGLQHLLLGLIREEEESATQLLRGRRADSNQIRLELRERPYMSISRERARTTNPQAY